MTIKATKSEKPAKSEAPKVSAKCDAAFRKAYDAQAKQVQAEIKARGAQLAITESLAKTFADHFERAENTSAGRKLVASILKPYFVANYVKLHGHKYQDGDGNVDMVRAEKAAAAPWSQHLNALMGFMNNVPSEGFASEYEYGVHASKVLKGKASEVATNKTGTKTTRKAKPNKAAPAAKDVKQAVAMVANAAPKSAAVLTLAQLKNAKIDEGTAQAIIDLLHLADEGLLNVMAEYADSVSE
jgi:hypothetical protein